MTSSAAGEPGQGDFKGMEAERRTLEALLTLPQIKGASLEPRPGGAAYASIELSQRHLAGNASRRLALGCVLSEAELELGSLGRGAGAALELAGAGASWVSPSGRRRVVVRPGETNKPGTQLEVWSRRGLLCTVVVPDKVHGGVFSDPWFGGAGAAWAPDESRVAYVAEAPKPPSPWTSGGAAEGGPAGEEWSLRGPAAEDWGERYTGKRDPAIFVLDLAVSGDALPAVKAVAPRGLGSEVASLGQPVWVDGGATLVFTVWPHRSTNFPALPQRLGIVYCFNRPCYLAAVKWDAETGAAADDAVALTPPEGSAFSASCSPDGRTLVFLSQNEAVRTGVHAATAALRAFRPAPGWLERRPEARPLVDVVRQPAWEADDLYAAFPGLYAGLIGAQCWAADGRTLLLISAWRSTTAIVAVDVQTGSVRRLSPPPGPQLDSWALLAAGHGAQRGCGDACLLIS